MIDMIVGSVILAGIVFLICYPFIKIKLKRMEKKFERQITPELFKKLNNKNDEVEEKINIEYKEVENARNRKQQRRTDAREERFKRRTERENAEARAREQSNEGDNSGGNSETETIKEPGQEGIQIPEASKDGGNDSFIKSDSSILSEQDKETRTETRTELEEDDDDFMD